MSKMIKVVAVGALAGKTGNFGGWDFEDGVTYVPAHLPDAVRMLGSFYSAYPEGSKELEPAAPAKKTMDELKGLTADELKAYAKETFGKELTGNKLQLLNELEALSKE